VTFGARLIVRLTRRFCVLTCRRARETWDETIIGTITHSDRITGLAEHATVRGSPG
jgi:hypothetical protein